MLLDVTSIHVRWAVSSGLGSGGGGGGEDCSCICTSTSHCPLTPELISDMLRSVRTECIKCSTAGLARSMLPLEVGQTILGHGP
eukprot:8787759-Pyramimonas_sp.AAC.1